MEKPAIFYNMYADLVHNGKITRENVAIVNIFEKSGTRFFELYFYKDKHTQIIDSHFIHEMGDYATDKIYKTSADLLEHFTKKMRKRQLPKPVEKTVNLGLLESLKDELTLAVFIARLGKGLTAFKQNSMSQYITQKYPEFKSLSAQYVADIVSNFNPTEADFYKSLENLKSKEIEEIKSTVNLAAKLTLEDGVLQYEEKLYLAEIVQYLREFGVEPDIDL